MLSRFWTITARRLLLPVCASGLLAACASKSSSHSIRPVTADIQIGSVTDNPVIFMQKASATGDMVVVNIVLRTPTPVPFDAINLEILFDAGLVQIAGPLDSHQFCGLDPNSSPYPENPLWPLLCTCAPPRGNPQCVSTTSASVCFSPIAGSSGVSCPTVSSASPTACVLDPQQTPICVSNVGQANAGLGDFVAGIAANTGACCPGTTAPVGETTIATVGLIAATVGTSRIQFVSGGSGGCGILSNGVPLGIPCNDGNATLVATR